MRLSLALVAVLVIAGCTPEFGESSSSGPEDSVVAIPEATIPPDRRTPFCAIMLDLDLTLPTDPLADVTDQVLAAYRRALPVAPAEISVELEAVIIGLETDTNPTLPATIPTSIPNSVPTTEPAATEPPATVSTDPNVTTPGDGTADLGDDFAEEGYLPDDAPQIRLNEFVDFHCRDNVNNPGPPATPPLVELPPATEP